MCSLDFVVEPCLLDPFPEGEGASWSAKYPFDAGVWMPRSTAGTRTASSYAAVEEVIWAFFFATGASH